MVFCTSHGSELDLYIKPDNLAVVFFRRGGTISQIKDDACKKINYYKRKYHDIHVYFLVGIPDITTIVKRGAYQETILVPSKEEPSNGSWCMGIKGEMSGTVCVTFTWDMYIYIWVVYSLCFFCCLFITVTWWYVWCIEWPSGNQEEVQACLVTLWLFIISCYSLYKTTVGLLCSWFQNNPHSHKYSMDFHV